MGLSAAMVETVSVICVDSCSMGLSAALLVTCMCCLIFAIVLLCYLPKTLLLIFSHFSLLFVFLILLPLLVIVLQKFVLIFSLC